VAHLLIEQPGRDLEIAMDETGPEISVIGAVVGDRGRGLSRVPKDR
jgi:hypothetical protein